VSLRLRTTRYGSAFRSVPEARFPAARATAPLLAVISMGRPHGKILDGWRRYDNTSDPFSRFCFWPAVSRLGISLFRTVCDAYVPGCALTLAREALDAHEWQKGQ
jgi:hypothetical protein